MSKVLLYTDVHWSRTSSIVRKVGEKYSIKLEGLIKSMNWVNELATKYNCDFMICAGDFMDKSTCTDEELTALKDIEWNNLPCYFLCGNHESSNNDLKYSSVNALINNSNEHKFKLINKSEVLDLQKAQIHFLPYVIESDRKPIEDYLQKVDKTKKQIIVSHNDIKGMCFGANISELGFGIEEITNNCDLYCNGHLHNQNWLNDKILNLGSISGHNFTNDSNKYQYGAWILDTDTCNLDFYENPYSFNFYKLEINKPDDYKQFEGLKQNAVVNIKLNSIKSLTETIHKELEKYKDRIVEGKVIPVLMTDRAEDDEVVENISELRMDHLAEFRKFCLNALPNNQILLDELTAICK